MLLKKWEDLPIEMQNDKVREYYDILKKKQISLFFKRVFDIVASLCLLIVLSPVFLVLAVLIKLDSKGPVFFRQERVTRYGRRFRIFKFRTMVQDADKGLQVTVNNDSRITRVGNVIRRFRLDEICQLIDILLGNMSFVGTRPEVPKYVECYTEEMLATLLLPAGVTSEACILYKNESELLQNADNTDEVYVNSVLPEKMRYNLRSVKQYGFWNDIGTMFKTVFAVFGKDYSVDDEIDASDLVIS